MAALKEKSSSNSTSGKNPHMRSLTVDDFSQKIHAEAHVRPHKVAALKVVEGSTGSPDRHMSFISTHNEALELQISPHKLATLLNLSKGSTGSPSKAKVQISLDRQAATSPHIYRNMGQKPIEYTYAFKQLKLKRDTKPSQVNIYLNKSKARRIYTRAIIIRKRAIKRKNTRVYAEKKHSYKYNDNDIYYYYKLRGDNYYYNYTYKYLYQYLYNNDYNAKRKGDKYHTPTIEHEVMTAKTTEQNSKKITMEKIKNLRDKLVNQE